MDLNEWLKSLWKEASPDNVVRLSDYMYERVKRHNSATALPIEFWFTKRTYEEAMTHLKHRQKLLIRQAHNKRVIATLKAKEPVPPQGS